MFTVKNVPVVIEPGVGAIEADFMVSEMPGKTRAFPVHLMRLALDGEVLEALPFIPATKTPHVFALAPKPEDSVVLVVYDALGRIQFVYTRDETGRAWEKRSVAPEHAGKAVTQFSVRYFFGTEKSRDEFMTCVERIMTAVQQKEEPDDADVRMAFKLMSRSRTGPVVLPVAVAKADLKKVKL